VKLGALEISSDVWIVARDETVSEDLIRQWALMGLSDMIKDNLPNITQ